MDGNKPKGLLAVLSNCKDPAREAEFNKWYNEVHVPDILGTGAFKSASRWTATWDYTWAGKPQTKYVALYETDRNALDAQQVLGKTSPQRREAGRMSPLLTDTSLLVFNCISSYVPDWVNALQTPVRTRGLVFVGMNNTKPERDSDFNIWYNGVHAQDYMETPSVSAYHRFKNPRFQPGLPQYLGMAEIENEDVAKVLHNIQHVVTPQHPAPFPNMVDRTFRLQCKRIF